MESIALARTSEDVKERKRLIRRANRLGDRVLKTLAKVHKKARQRRR